MKKDTCKKDNDLNSEKKIDEFLFFINVFFLFLHKHVFFLLITCFLNKRLRVIKINIHINLNHRKKMYVRNKNCFHFSLPEFCILPTNYFIYIKTLILS